MTGSQIRIAYILTPITFGGAEKVSLNFLRNVDRQNFQIQPILLVRPWEEETYFGHELRRMGYAYESVPVALNTEGDPLRVPRVAVRLYEYLKKGSYDLVHTHGYFADICGQPAARILGRSGISTCHGFINTDTKLQLYNRLDKYALRLCEVVIAVSETIKTELIRSGLHDSRITVIPNAVSSSWGRDEWAFHRREKRFLLHIAPDELVVGYLGRLSVEKGVAHLLEAVHGLLEAGRRVRLVIVGDGPEREALEQQAEATGLRDRVTFAGFQTDPESWYPVFDIFVLPSLMEGTPLALLESMAAGLPVIASAVGGVPKIVADGVNGLLVPPGVPSAIKVKLQLLHDDPCLSLRLAKAGLETIKSEYSIGVWCRRTENSYVKALGLSTTSTAKEKVSGSEV